jgi:phosphatidylserine decarboxylase
MGGPAPEQIEYVDRATGERRREIVYGETELRLLYYRPLGRLLRRLMVRRPWFSRCNGWFKRRPGSRARIVDFATRYQVNVEEAEKPLTPGARPICREAEALLSPADGRALACALSADTHFSIKGQKVAVAELLGDGTAARALAGGWALVVRLAPKDYHRFHFPVDGHADAARFIGGLLESVHPLALAAGARSFANQRCVTRLESRWGPVFMVEVGALTVGTIEQTYTPGPVMRGAEKGFFRFGGSTVVLLWGPQGPVIDADIRANSAVGLETLVNYGTRIASALNKDFP